MKFSDFLYNLISIQSTCRTRPQKPLLPLLDHLLLSNYKITKRSFIIIIIIIEIFKVT